MRKSRFSDEQISAALAELDHGAKIGEVSRRLNVSAHTIYQWRRKFSALEASDVRQMRAMADEIGKLKRIVADQAVELLAARDLLRKNF